MTKQLKNVAASVQTKLLQIAKAKSDDFQLVLLRHANERFLYRLACSPHFAVTPQAVETEFPVLLAEYPAPKIRIYPRETVVAEKLDAIVQLGLTNTRMKDFYDLWFLSERFEFEGSLLLEAVRATFERRKTAFPKALPMVFTAEFSNDRTKLTQWTAFFRKARAPGAPTLPQTLEKVAAFVSEPLRYALGQTRWDSHWVSGGPWRSPA